MDNTGTEYMYKHCMYHVNVSDNKNSDIVIACVRVLFSRQRRVDSNTFAAVNFQKHCNLNQTSVKSVK